MKRVFRLMALVFVLAAVGFWLATGANRGWTKTSVPKRIFDEVTGLDGVVYEKSNARENYAGEQS